MFSKNSDGLLRLSAPCLYVCNLVAQIVKVRFRFGAGCDGWVSCVGLARLVPAVALKHVEAGWDGGISSSQSERFLCGDLIGGIGGGLSLISASMTMISLSSSLAIEF